MLQLSLQNLQLLVKPSVAKPFTPAPHKIQGIGANFIPKNLDLDLVDEVISIESAEAIDWARKTATQEGILVGIF